MGGRVIMVGWESHKKSRRLHRRFGAVEENIGPSPPYLLIALDLALPGDIDIGDLSGIGGQRAPEPENHRSPMFQVHKWV